jgi:hypothetical protein
MSGPYTPLPTKEQEVLNKLIDQENDLYIEVDEWGYHPSPTIIHGDRRIQVKFAFQFTKPDYWMPVDEFRLKLKSKQDGSTLYTDRLDVNPPGQDSLYIRSGRTIDLAWEILVNAVSDELVRRINPGPQGEEVMSVDPTTGEVNDG